MTTADTLEVDIEEIDGEDLEFSQLRDTKDDNEQQTDKTEDL